MIERASIEAVIDAIVTTGIRNQLRIELCPLPDSSGFGMTGSGMLVINPPYTLANDMREALSEIAPLLGAQVQWTVQQLVED